MCERQPSAGVRVSVCLSIGFCVCVYCIETAKDISKRFLKRPSAVTKFQELGTPHVER